MKAGRQDNPYAPTIKESAKRVSNSQELIEAVARASDGDQIVLEDARYDTGWLKTAVRIHLMGNNRWGAVLGRGSLLDLSGSGSIVEGLAFEEGTAVQSGGSRDHSIYVRGNGIVIRDNRFSEVGKHSTISDRTGVTIEAVNVRDLVVENNLFVHNYGIAIAVSDDSRQPIIRHNDFFDTPDGPQAGEIAHLGSANTTPAGTAPTDDRIEARVEFNHVRRWRIEPELISVKSDSNLIANNLVEDSGIAAFVIRMGNDNIVERNVMTGITEFPLRISGARNVFRNNYFAGTGAMMFLHNEVFYNVPEKNLHFAYLAANDNVIETNTFVGFDQVFGVFRNQEIVVRDAPRRNVFKNNLVSTKDVDRMRHQMFSTQYVTFEENEISPLCSSHPQN